MTDTSLFEWPQRLLMIAICMFWAVLLGREVGERKPARVRLDKWVYLGMTPLYVFTATMAAEVPLGGAFPWVAAACFLPPVALGVQWLSRKPVGKDYRVQVAVIVLYMVGVFTLLALTPD